MTQLEKDIKIIVKSWKTNLFFLEKPLSRLSNIDKFPTIEYTLNSVLEYEDGNVEYHRNIFQIRIWDRYPVGCGTLDEIRLKAKTEVEEYRKIIRTILRILTSTQYTFQYKRTKGLSGAYRFQLIPYEVTDQQFFGVVVKASLTHKTPLDCCDKVYYDDTNYKKSLWSSKNK